MSNFSYYTLLLELHATDIVTIFVANNSNKIV